MVLVCRRRAAFPALSHPAVRGGVAAAQLRPLCMFVRWQNSKTVSRRKAQGKVNRCRAVLVESVRVEGKPTQKYIAFLASYEPGSRSWGQPFRFWHDALGCLDRLGNRISLEDRHPIEAALAAWVPRPCREE